MRKSIGKKRKKWLLEDEESLLEIWQQHFQELRGLKKNAHVYKVMAEALVGTQTYTPEEVSVKIHNLTNKYKNEKRVRGPSSWIHYDKVDEIFSGLKLGSLEGAVEEIKGPFSSVHYDKVNTIFRGQKLENVESIEEISQDTDFSLNDLSSNSSDPLTAQRFEAFTPSTSVSQKRKREDSMSAQSTSSQNLIDQLKCTNAMFKEGLEKILKADQEFLAVEMKRNEILQKQGDNAEKLTVALLKFLNKQ